MILADNRLKQPTMVSLIIAFVVSFGLGVIPSGADVERKGGAPGKAGLSQVAKDLQGSVRASVPDDEITPFVGGFRLTPPSHTEWVCAMRGRKLHLPCLAEGAVRGRAPPADHWS